MAWSVTGSLRSINAMAPQQKDQCALIPVKFSSLLKRLATSHTLPGALNGSNDSDLEGRRFINHWLLMISSLASNLLVR